MPRMKSRIPSRLKGEDLDNFIRSYKASSLVRQELVSILKEDLEHLIKDDESPSKLSREKFQLELSYNLGYRRALRYFIDLLTQDLKE